MCVSNFARFGRTQVSAEWTTTAQQTLCLEEKKESKMRQQIVWCRVI